MDYDPIRLEIFKHLFAAIPEEMGAVLRRASLSPNIKERRDFSCALFNAEAKMVAQAAHIPVHLGSMPLSVAAAIERFPNLKPGDAVLLNDPFRGGTHLPDITLVTPVFEGDGQDEAIPAQVRKSVRRPYGFVASRAHHADVGGITPGSMPIAREIYQEGLIIPPVKLVEAGQTNPAVLDLILANVRTPQERLGDLEAQLASNRRGAVKFGQMIARYGSEEVSQYMQELLSYTERTMRRLLAGLPDGQYSFTDFLDDDGIGEEPVPIRVTVNIEGDQATIDFSGSASQQRGSINAVAAITLSAVYYVFRCLIGLEVPNNSGCLAPLRIIAPQGSIVNALSPAPVAGGNVETSQRIVDVLFGALAQALPGRVPAASQGTMNNVTIGGWDPGKNHPFTYYETIGGGMGARPDSDGPSAVHSHMTNTLNTPVEALEYTYPLRVLRYEIRRGSGGAGRNRGGDGIRRDVQLLAEAQITLLTERRRLSPYGLAGGRPGSSGVNQLIRGAEIQILPGKGSLILQAGDILSLQTPGGGGFGSPEKKSDQPISKTPPS